MSILKLGKIIRNKIFQRITVFVLILLTLSVVFFAGDYSSSSQTEICAEFFTALTRNHTRGKTYSALVVEENGESDKHLLDTTSEFYRLYGSFRQDRACFANTYNVSKESNIILDGSNVDNLSLLFTSSGLNIEYDERTGWRHEFYPILMMFDAPKKDRPPTPGGYCFISQSQADALLESNYLGYIPTKPFTIDDYQKLQYNVVNLCCDGGSFPYCILSIFYEEGYYYDALNEIMGNFTFVFGGAPGKLQKQATYFMRDYTFQNEYYINYVKQQYGKNDFIYSIGKYNVIDSFADKINVSESIFVKRNDVIAISLFSVSIVLAVLLMFFIFLSSYGISWLDTIIFYISLFIPFLLFKIVSIITEESRWFCAVSTQYNMWIIIVLSCLFPIIVTVRRARKGAKSNE